MYVGMYYIYSITISNLVIQQSNDTTVLQYSNNIYI